MAAVNNGKFQKKGNNNGNGKFKKKGPCWECGGPHFKRDCWELPENSSKRPNGWVSRKNKGGSTGEVSGATVTGWKGHFIMCAVTEQLFPDTMELLNDPNIWVADTAATTDMTRHSSCMFDMKSASKNDSAITSNGSLSNATKLGKLTMMQCNNQGIELRKIMFEEVAVCPECPFNLVSITKRLMSGGWKLSGDSNYIAITKGEMEL
ncbi:unknown protein (Partial), partial [Seminavis robusta]|eukprot:Sro4347_g353790.1 n/a (206) ;mRNA; r:152-771